MFAKLGRPTQTAALTFGGFYYAYEDKTKIRSSCPLPVVVVMWLNAAVPPLPATAWRCNYVRQEAFWMSFLMAGQESEIRVWEPASERLLSRLGGGRKQGYRVRFYAGSIAEDQRSRKPL